MYRFTAPLTDMKAHYDVVCVGTGFSTSFFLYKFLTRQTGKLRVLVLEAGPRLSHAEQLVQGDPTGISSLRKKRANDLFVNLTPEKEWTFYWGFGGGSNCWFACTPRQLPEDFRMRSTYGVGRDWPFTYDDLETYYGEAERIMSISGSDEPCPSPRSTPYPQPPHRYSVLAKLLKDAFPEHIFPQPTARARLAIRGQRPGCCSNNVCHHCPIDAKFTVLNGMKMVFADPRIEMRFDSRVDRVEYAGNQATGVIYTSKDSVRTETTVSAVLVVLGANAIFNPFILMRSGIHHPELGRGLVEQVSVPVFIELDGVTNFAGSTIVAGHGYMFYGGEHRRKRAGALMQINNRVQVSASRGEWISRGSLLFSFEDLRQPQNQVSISKEDPQKPVVNFRGRSSYAAQGIRELDTQLGVILGRLPVKKYEIGPTWPTEAHIMGTTVMGVNPGDSVVDQDGIHHGIRNLVVLGSGNFPTAPPANPTLTISAHALRSADRLSRRGRET